MTRFGGAQPTKNPQPPNAASLLPQISLNNVSVNTSVLKYRYRYQKLENEIAKTVIASGIASSSMMDT